MPIKSVVRQMYEDFMIHGSTKTWDHYLEKEKEQIIDIFCDGFCKSREGFNGEYGIMDINNIAKEIQAEKYYNKNYKNK